MNDVLTIDRHVMDMCNRLRASAKRQDVLRQDLRRPLVNSFLRPRHFEKSLEFDEAVAVLPDIPGVQDRLLHGNRFDPCILRLLRDGRLPFTITFPNLHRDDVPIRQGGDHLLIEHRALSQEDRHIFLIDCLPYDHAFLKLIHCILLQHSASTPSLENIIFILYS